MSVSPQSLARTRDKRSHKVPARFNDTVYALKDATEVLRTSTRSRPGSLVAKRDHEDDVGEEKEEVLKPSFKKQNKAGSQNETTSTPTPPRPLVEHIDPNSPTTPPPSTTPSPTGPPPPATVQPKTTATPKQQPINSSNSSSKKESSSSALSSKKKTNKGFSLIVKQQSAKKNDTINPATTPRQATPAEISGGDSNFNIHQHSNIAPNVVPNFPHNPAPVATPARARAPTPMPAKNQQGNRYFTNLTPNQPWSRIIKNEPIVLPLSVGNIGPITATLQQIARHALDPIFRSRKATLCLAYQDERKLNYITSNFAALIKITKYLGVKDRLNLRCVNRTWKSVIDCETVWKEVTLNSNDTNLNWKVLTNKYLDRYRTTDIIFNGYGLGDGVHFDSLYELGLSLPSRLPDLKRMFIKSVNSEQNSVAYNLLDGLLNSQALNDSTKDRVLRCVWEIKVGVDPLGIATVDLNRSAVKDPTLNLVPTECNHDGCIELYDLKEKYEKHHSVKINIKPI